MLNPPGLLYFSEYFSSIVIFYCFKVIFFSCSLLVPRPGKQKVQIISLDPKSLTMKNYGQVLCMCVCVCPCESEGAVSCRGWGRPSPSCTEVPRGQSCQCSSSPPPHLCQRAHCDETCPFSCSFWSFKWISLLDVEKVNYVFCYT